MTERSAQLPGPGVFARSPGALVGVALLVLIVAAWTWRAFHDPSAYDTGAAWSAGSVAWTTGHPEGLPTWTGMPFLAAAIALVSRVISSQTAGYLMTSVNVALVLGAAGVFLHRVRLLISPIAWWVLAFALVSFAPLMSTVWWKQFNVIALVVGAAGFELVRRRRFGWAGATIGLSVAIKPMLILLPFVLTARRATRRAGIVAIGWVVALNLAAQGLLAIRAHDLSPLDPLAGLNNLLHKTRHTPFLCHPVNFSPESLLCRTIGGSPHWTLQRIAASIVVLLLGAWVVDALRGRSAMSWEIFAFVSALSAMLSPFEWSHYQVMLAPLFLLLFVRFVSEGAGFSSWLGLVTAYLLASVMWQPYGTLGGSIGRLLFGTHETYDALTLASGVRLQEGLAQLAQYVLVITGALWYARHAVTGQPRQGSVGSLQPESDPVGHLSRSPA